MKFDLSKSVAILKRTPTLLSSLLNDLPEDWIKKNEGKDTWSPYDVIGHLVHGEKTDWISRAKIILSEEEDRSFKPFDRFAQFEESKGKSINQLLDEFRVLRETNLIELESLNISDKDLQLNGMHPEFGTVTLEQLLSTWVVHDLGHIAQISRVMAKQYEDEVGPWKTYLGILK